MLVENWVVWPSCSRIKCLSCLTKLRVSILHLKPFHADTCIICHTSLRWQRKEVQFSNKSPLEHFSKNELSLRTEVPLYVTPKISEKIIPNCELPIVQGDMLRDPQWTPKAAESSEPYLNYDFPRTYTPCHLKEALRPLWRTWVADITTLTPWGH